MPQGDIGLGLFEVVGVAREHVLNTVTAGHAFSKRRLVFVGKHGPGYDGDYDDEPDDGSQWAQIEVDNEKAEPASIDGEYGGGAFSSYNRVHVAVSPIKADPMGFGSSVPTGRSSPTLKARG